MSSIASLNVELYNDGGKVITSDLITTPILITNIGMLISGLLLIISGVKSD
ncbi:MAG: hypothetical protein GF364_19155 [Candidatus Lokiarchaeota archaeon]|nr:hypothetical protein [Candidatus Lokiarchaeota archaeon]